MDTIKKRDIIALLVLMSPVITLMAYATYRLALEVWCIAYGLIY